MKKGAAVIVRAFILSALILFLWFGNSQPVQAATCTWTGGDATTDWFSAGNWSNCNSGIPGSGDGVIIADTSIDPILTADTAVASLTINSNAVLNIGFDSTLTTGTFDLYGRLTGLGHLIITDSMFWGHGGGGYDGLMDGSGTTTLNSGAYLSFQDAAYQALYERTFNNNGIINQTNAYGFKVDRNGTLNNNGTINVNNGSNFVTLFMREDYPGSGVVNNTGSILISDASSITSDVSLNNSGTIELETGVLTFNRPGTHSGSISGDAGSTLQFSNTDSLSSITHVFQGTSAVTVPNLIINNNILDISGTFNITNTTGTYINCFGNAQVGFQETATIVSLSEKITLSQCHLSLPASLSGFEQPKLRVGPGSQLTNLGSWSISSEFLWSGGTIDGTGSTTVLLNTNYRMYGTTGLSLNAQTINNQTTASWESNTITLGNNANFINQAGFEAKATTAMNGSTNGLFDNQGVFTKKTDETTTTMNIDFDNSGEILIEGGTLVFPNGITAQSGTEITLGGDFETSGTLDLQGATLNGSGTVNGDVNNAGIVAPGNSPGKIIISGNYEQTSQGSLQIEINGITAETEFDVLEITGTASLSGTLDVVFGDGYTPIAGNQFKILKFLTVDGDFGTFNLPELPANLYWEKTYAENDLILSIEENPTYLVYCPMIVR